MSHGTYASQLLNFPTWPSFGLSARSAPQPPPPASQALTPVLDKNQAVAVRTAVLDRIRQSTREDIGSGRVAGKVGIVTGVGPSTGIGTFASRLFAREGARALYLLDLSDALAGFASELSKTFPETKVGLLLTRGRPLRELRVSMRFGDLPTSTR